MIQLTRLNGQPFILNAFFIEEVEALPDTTVTLTNGKKLIVRESDEEVRNESTRFYQQVGAIRTIDTQSRTD